MKKSQQNKISWKEYYNIFVGWTSEQKSSIHNHVLMFEHIHTEGNVAFFLTPVLCTFSVRTLISFSLIFVSSTWK